MFARMLRIIGNEDGFTLVELIVVSVLSLVVLAAVVNVFASGMDDFQMVDEQTRAVRDSGKNMLYMAKYLRASEGLQGPPGDVNPSDYGVTSRGDYDNDGQAEEVTFVLDTGTQTLSMTWRDHTGSTRTQVYAESVRNAALGTSIFTYFDVNGAVLSNPSQRAARTRSMQIRLIIDADPSRPPNELDTATTITLRNAQG